MKAIVKANTSPNVDLATSKPVVLTNTSYRQSALHAVAKSAYAHQQRMG